MPSAKSLRRTHTPFRVYKCALVNKGLFLYVRFFLFHFCILISTFFSHCHDFLDFLIDYFFDIRKCNELIKFIFGKILTLGKDTFKDCSFFIKPSISFLSFFLFLLTDELFSFVLSLLDFFFCN